MARAAAPNLLIADGGQMLETVNCPQEKGVRITTGTMVDATIIHAPSSTKNRKEKRDPEMHQTKKGNQWYFGMKAHVGVDSKTKIIHSAAVTAAMWPTRRCCRSCCTARRRGCGATKRIADRARSFMNRHRGRKTAPPPLSL